MKMSAEDKRYVNIVIVLFAIVYYTTLFVILVEVYNGLNYMFNPNIYPILFPSMYFFLFAISACGISLGVVLIEFLIRFIKTQIFNQPIINAKYKKGNYKQF